MIDLALSAPAAAAFALLGVEGIRRDRAAARMRGRMLDEAAGVLQDGRIGCGPDRFPTLQGRHEGRAVHVELVADTLVVRRLPQLWLKFTLACESGTGATIGALARPTGAEYYSLVHDLAERIVGAEAGDQPLLVRASASLTTADAAHAARRFGTLFADPAMKEAVVAPRGIRLVRQLAEGTRGAHLLRQARFPLESVPPRLVLDLLAQADALAAAFAPPALDEAA